MGKHLKYFTKAHLPVYLTFIYITYLISQCLCKLWEVFLCVTHWCLTVWCVMCGLCCCYHINIMSLSDLSEVFICYLLNIMSFSDLWYFLLLFQQYNEFVWSERSFLVITTSLTWVCLIFEKFSSCYLIIIMSLFD